ncbi:MAG: hypothetical protein PHO53_04705 [Actinomycetota bacterium]|nr:hypothetical protein [Actinomycetota bacterium]
MLGVLDVQTIALIAVGVVAWLFFAFSTAAVARSNGSSYNVWLFVGFLTGPVGFVFAWLYFRIAGERARRERHASRDSGLPEMTRCPNCGQYVPESYKRCQFCGAPLRGRKRR